MDDAGIAKPLAADGDRAHDPFERLERQMRNRERDLDLEKVAERPQACVQQDVANLRPYLTRRAIALQRQAGFVREEFLEDGGAVLIEHEERIALDRTREDLMNAGHFFVLNEWTEMARHLLDRAHGDLRHLQLHAVPRQLRERSGGAAEPDVNELDERGLHAGREVP